MALPRSNSFSPSFQMTRLKNGEMFSRRSVSWRGATFCALAAINSIVSEDFISIFKMNMQRVRVALDGDQTFRDANGIVITVAQLEQKQCL